MVLAVFEEVRFGTETVSQLRVFNLAALAQTITRITGQCQALLAAAAKAFCAGYHAVTGARG